MTPDDASRVRRAMQAWAEGRDPPRVHAGDDIDGGCIIVMLALALLVLGVVGLVVGALALRAIMAAHSGS